MPSRITSAAVFGMAITSAVAAPLQKTSPIGKRQESTSYTCVMNAAATNSMYVGAPVPRSLDESTAKVSKRQFGAQGSFPTPGGFLAPNSFPSSTGITIGIAGATKPLWSSEDFNVWNMAEAQTISTADTGLPFDVQYWNAGGIPTFSCGMSYNGVSYKCDTSSDIDIFFVGSSSTQSGQVQFPCELTPPGSSAESPLFAPGWCTANVIQHQKPDPAVDPYTLDVKLYDAAGTPIGVSDGAVTNTAVTGGLPYTFDVGTGAVDDDPVTFAYGDQSWDSNDASHQCSVGAYDSGSRSIDCGWTC